jgi:16S rRNA (uracil1498-N3)-methyltransferase
VLAHDTRGLGRALVKEQMAASFERGDHVLGAVQDEGWQRRGRQTFERVVRLPHRVELGGENARAHRVERALADLRLDEIRMAALKLARVQDGARDPVRLLGSSRTFAEERRVVLGSGVDAVVAPWSGGRKDEIGDASRMVDHQVLRDQAAHRGTEHRGGGDTGGVEHHDRVERHRRHRRVGAALRVADSARVEGDHPVGPRKVGHDRIERRAARAEAGDEQERVTVSADHDQKAEAIGCSRGETYLGHRITIAGGGCRTMHAAVPRFFVEPDQVAGGRATLTGTDANHLSRALRALVGETIVIVEDGRIEHGVELDVVTPARVSGAIVWSRPVDGEPRLSVHVLQAVPAQAMDATVEALTEAGAATIRPVLTHRTVSRPDPSRVIHRLERWRLIAREAAQLAGRAAPPDVHSILPLGEALAALPAGARILACVIRQDAAPILSAVPAPPADIGLVIGPEGGLDASDLRALGDAGAVSVHLGSRTLPSRLAGAVATSLLLAGAGDLDTPAAPPPA